MTQAHKVLQATPLTLFEKRLPKKPYSTDYLGAGLNINSVKQAIKSRYIQHNGPTHQYWLVFDVDRAGAAIDWADRSCPPPNFTVKNPANGHAHIFYGLQVSVRTAPDGSASALRYAAAVESALRLKLDADPGYSGLVSKNPLNPFWQVAVWEENLYTLSDLESWLDISVKNKTEQEYGLGRNCALFEKLRMWAYRAIRQGWPEYERWLEAVLTRADAYNDFNNPLGFNEVKATARSVAKYTYKNFSKEGFSRWQAVQGAKGGKAKGRANAEKRVQARLLAAKGLSVRAIAKELNCSKSSVSNWVSK